MKRSNVRGFVAASMAAACFASGYAMAATPAHAVPGAYSAAPKDLGRVDPSKLVNLTLVLKPHNEAQYDKDVDALFDPSSPTYHKWFTDADFQKYAPTQAEFDQLKSQLVSQGFTVVSSDPNRFSLRVRGTVGSAQSAFQTEIHTFSLANGHTYQGILRPPALAGAAGSLVKAVAGLERHQVRPKLSFQKDPITNQQLGTMSLAEVQAAGGVTVIFSTVALSPPFPFPFTYSGPNGVTATYGGTLYAASGIPVSYAPQELQVHYGVFGLIDQGYDGTGETIALVEAYGYDGAESDANLFAQTWGLPGVNSSNFSVVLPDGQPVNSQAAELTGWDVEIALDIQSAHGIAPGAKIAVVVSTGQEDEDFLATLTYLVDHKLANTVSNSWETDDEIIAGKDELDAYNSILKKGAAVGISFQFATGDSGDLGLGTPVGAVGVPSNSPYAVAVGGTSVLNNPYGPGDVVTGWGTSLAELSGTECVFSSTGASCSVGPFDPPIGIFGGGAGGGQSQYFAKPSWQSALPGSYRQVPDVSAVADPFTGFPIFVTQEGTTFFKAGVGGTSLASPVFSAIWAIANQYNGKSLGLASPLIAALQPGQIRDIVPTSDLIPNNITGSITDANGTTNYTTDALFTGLLFNTTDYAAALWPQEDGLGISFGLDSSLSVTPGWDNVTGYGEPNGLPFIQAVSALARGGGKNGGKGGK